MTVRAAVCVDVGSTFTKAAVVDLDTGALLATAAARTTADSDVLRGLDAAAAQAVTKLRPGTDTSTIYVCSSAGGGLRLAVVGYEELVTARAGRRVGLSAGARVVHVAAGRLDRAGLAALRAARTDVVLLVGGTDGGDADVLRHNAARLAGARLRVPVVVAGNVEAGDEVLATLTERGVPATATQNVLPRIGALNPGPARAAIREVFLRHVIGGKRLSRGPRFASLVRAATPDAVLTAVELLGDHLDGDLLVVDVGGATTDVYSVRTPDGSSAPAPAAGTAWHSRSVEGDLGLRWNAPSVLAAAAAERLLTPARAQELAPAAATLAANPELVPADPTGRAVDAELARLAVTVALRRHARGDRASGETGGPDLRRVGLFVGSGGALRHAAPGQAQRILNRVLADHAGGWALPLAARAVVDIDYVLAPAGLLAPEHPEAALALLERLHRPA